MITIDLLKNHPETISQLVSIWYEVLGKIWMPDTSIEEAVQLLAEHLNDNTLPLTLVALDAGKPIGMCSLRGKSSVRPDFIYANLSPKDLTKIGWLASLVVDPTYQKQGVGKLLIEATKNKALDFGINRLILVTFDKTLLDYYARFGWKIIGMDKFKDHPVTVMEALL
jgi:GNAT superfamily N-acetyltransferase